MKKEMTDYANLLGDIKTRIRQAQIKATLSANAEMTLMYWDIGRMIVERQQAEGWGTGVLRRLANDLKSEIPEVKGFSERNLKRMTQFYREYPGLDVIGPLPVAQTSTIVAEYALLDIQKPIGVSAYELTRALPENLKSSLPSIEDIEAELQSEVGKDANEP